MGQEPAHGWGSGATVNHAAEIRARNPLLEVVGRGRQNITFARESDNQFRFVGVLGKLHYGVDSDLEIDDAWQSSVAPWDFEMVQNDWSVTALARFDAGQIILYTHQSGATLGLQPQQLQWTNDLDQIEAIANPQNVNAVADDNKLEWTGAYGTDLDFQWFCRHSGLSKYLVINNAAAIGSPLQFIIDGGNPVLRLQLIFQKSPTVEIFLNGEVWDEAPNSSISTSGTIDWRDSATGEVLWQFHMPLAKSSDIDEADARVLSTFLLRKTGPNLFLEIRTPWDFLEVSQYPILIDANFTDQPDETNSKDTELRQSAPTSNRCTDNDWYWDGSPTSGNVGVFEFDCSSIPAGATCDAAALSLWSYLSQTTTTFSIYSLHSNVSTWVECEATWDDYKSATNWPGAGGGRTSGTDYEADASPPTIAYPNNSIDTEAQGDLTTGNNLDAARIAGWFGATNTNYGIVGGHVGAQKRWWASNAATASYRPKISIDYTAVSGAIVDPIGSGGIIPFER